MLQVRKGVFETNSSSVHSITMCNESTYDQWKNGELYYSRYGQVFLTKDELEEIHREHMRKYSYVSESFEDWLYENGDYYTHDGFWKAILYDYDTFNDKFKTPSGDTVIAFGYYGEDR